MQNLKITQIDCRVDIGVFFQQIQMLLQTIDLIPPQTHLTLTMVEDDDSVSDFLCCYNRAQMLWDQLKTNNDKD